VSLWQACAGSAQPHSMSTHWSEQHGKVVEHPTPSSLQVEAIASHWPDVEPQTSAPQQSLLSTQSAPMFAHPHRPLVQMSEQHASGSVQGEPSAVQTPSVHSEPTHCRLPQQSEEVAQGCMVFAQPQVLVPGSHTSEPQQSCVLVQSSPAAAQAHMPVAPQRRPPQQIASVPQLWPTAAHAHTPPEQLPEQQSLPAEHGSPSSAHAGPGSCIESSAHVSAVSSQRRSPQQSESVAQSLPVPAQAGVQKLPSQ
jgi:hypothetical protein